MTDQLALFGVRRVTDRVSAFELQAPLEEVAPRAEQLHRKDEAGGSIAAATRAVDTGRAATEAAAVLEALARHPHTTSAELADRTPDIAHRLGQKADAWRTTCARRLPGLEDRGLVAATVVRLSLHRPHRDVDPNIAPCTVSEGAPLSIRWRRKETA